ncbi:MAG: hypothetical protein PUG75_00290 [Prevotella sp.]|nr:hypothetical protein [Prevotella sp.]
MPRTHTVGWFVGADARTYVPTVRMRFGAWPAQGAATTTDVYVVRTATTTYEGLVRTATTADVCSVWTLE